MRPKHYVKNVLVFAPVMFAGRLSDLDVLTSAFVGFVCFCLAASAVYAINDMNDVEKDRQHPTKRFRPIASGEVTIPEARILTVVLLALATALSILHGSLWAFAVLAAYVAINVAYSQCGIKSVPILDVLVLALGYVLRVLYGGLMCDIAVSSWLYLTVLAGSFYLGLGKRRGELKIARQTGMETRKVLQSYSYEFLDKNMYVFMALTISFYSLWAKEAGTFVALATIPLVMTIMMRYSLIIEGNSDGDPTGVLLSDKVMILLGAAFVVALLISTYFPF